MQFPATSRIELPLLLDGTPGKLFQKVSFPINFFEVITAGSECLTKQKYTEIEGNKSNVVQTAWAMMGLIYAGQVSSGLIFIIIIL
jgi:hypothetical protein